MRERERAREPDGHKVHIIDFQDENLYTRIDLSILLVLVVLATSVCVCLPHRIPTKYSMQLTSSILPSHHLLQVVQSTAFNITVAVSGPLPDRSSVGHAG